MSSIASQRTGPSAAAYASSKAGLDALIRAIAFDYAAHGVRANAVCPGWVRTEMSDWEMAQIAEAESITVDAAYARATSLVPQRRAAAPAEVAADIDRKHVYRGYLYDIRPLCAEVLSIGWPDRRVLVRFSFGVSARRLPLGRA